MKSVQFSLSPLLPGSPRHKCRAQLWKMFSRSSMWLSLANSHQPFCWQLCIGCSFGSLWISNAGRLLIDFWSTYLSGSNFFWPTFEFYKWSFAFYLSVWFQTLHKSLSAYRSTYRWKKTFMCQKSMPSFAIPFFTCTIISLCICKISVFSRNDVLCPFLSWLG